MTPILLLVFGVSPVTAIATDLWFAVITKVVGVRIHYRNRENIDWQVAKRLWMGSLPVAIAIAILVSYGGKIARMDWLAQAIGAAILITALGLWFSPLLMSFGSNFRLREPEQFKKLQPGLTVVAGGVLGLLVALTSVGAGALGSVALMYLYPLRMNPHRLVATDLVHAIPLAMVAGAGYLFAGMVDGKMLFALLVGSLPAVILGSLLASKLSSVWLKRSLAAVLLLVGVKVLL
nr:sulfite exporter TauE/SafE family protein [Bdellovibrio sp. HAGR004]